MCKRRLKSCPKISLRVKKTTVCFFAPQGTDSKKTNSLIEVLFVAHSLRSITKQRTQTKSVDWSMAAHLIWKALKNINGVYRGFNELWKKLLIQRTSVFLSPRNPARWHPSSSRSMSFKAGGLLISDSGFTTEWFFWKDMVIFWWLLLCSRVLQTMSH